MKVLVLGHSGMLGHMTKGHLGNLHEVCTTDHRWPTEEFKEHVSASDADFLVNCAGSIPQRKNSFEINSDLPVWLDGNFGGKVIHPGTDCEGDDGDYGISKKRAADWIVSEGRRTKIIKSSIVGPELRGRASLLSWFLSNPDGQEVNGFANHLWNGVTTLQWAKHAEKMIAGWDSFGKVSVIGTDCVSKYEMLLIFNEVYGRNVKVRRHEGEMTNKCLELDFHYGDLKTQLRDMRCFHDRTTP